MDDAEFVEPPLIKYMIEHESKKLPTINWSKHLSIILGKLESPGSAFTRNSFSMLHNNTDRFRALLINRTDVLPVIDDFVSSSIEKKETKCATKSAEYRRLGNEAYSARRFADASYLYTLAILFAPLEPDATGACSLALAYGNRSALFYEIGQWQEAIVDIDLALEAGHQAVQKLLLRKVDSLTSLGRVGEARRILNGEQMKNYDCLQRETLDGLEDGSDSSTGPPGPLALSDVTLILPEYEPSPRLSSLSRKLELKNDLVKGRYLVANVDIEPGDILAVELPFSSVLLKPYELAYCHHCCRRLDATGAGPKENSGAKKANAAKVKGQFLISGPLVPCTSCTRVLFCSPRCRTESWVNYHRFECPILPVLYEIGIGHLAFRLLLISGLDTVRNVARDGDQNRLDLKEPTDVQSHYSNVFKLVHHSEHFTVDDLIQYTVTAGMLTILAKEATFLVTEDIEFAGSILLRHILQLVTNAHSIAHFISSSSGTFLDCRIATALYPSISLLNHSCDPNVVATFDQGRLNLLRASKSIPAGEEVLNCYGVHFARYARVKRQKQLKSQYFFDCHCPRCKMETEQGFEGRYYPLACDKCRSLMFRNSQSSYICIDCSAEIPQSRISSRYASIDSTLSKATKLVDFIDYGLESGTYLADQLVTLEDVVMQLEKMLHAHSSLHLGKILDALGRLSNIFGEHEKAKLYLLQSVAIVEANYGGTSIELVCELIKLSDLLYIEIDGSECVNQKKIQQWREVTERALCLLRCFALIDCPPLGDDSCFFALEHGRLLERQVMLNQPKKTQLERMLD